MNSLRSVAATAWHGTMHYVETRLSGSAPIRVLTGSATGLSAPNDFPTADFVRLNQRVGPRQPKQPDVYTEYAGGWNGVAYRFFECAQSDETFRTWFRRGGPSPRHDLRYRQETHLFIFFVAGLASIESFSYMAYAMAAFIDPANFPIATAANKRAITPQWTVTQFATAFPGDNLTVRLDAVVASQDFRDWSATRNVLAHRISPPRQMYVGGPQHGTASWMGITKLDESVTRDRRTWLAGRLAELMQAAADFADARL